VLVVSADTTAALKPMVLGRALAMFRRTRISRYVKDVRTGSRVNNKMSVPAKPLLAQTYS
jgi:hypothetical protein